MNIFVRGVLNQNTNCGNTINTGCTQNTLNSKGNVTVNNTSATHSAIGDVPELHETSGDNRKLSSRRKTALNKLVWKLIIPIAVIVIASLVLSAIDRRNSSPSEQTQQPSSMLHAPQIEPCTGPATLNEIEEKVDLPPSSKPAFQILMDAERYFDYGRYEKVRQCYENQVVIDDPSAYCFSCVNQGYMYMVGVGSERDEVLALEYFRKAVDRGYTAALPYLLAYYLNDLDYENIVSTICRANAANNNRIAKWFGMYQSGSDSIDVCRSDLFAFCTRLSSDEQLDYIKSICKWSPWELADTIQKLDSNGMLHIPYQSGVKCVGATMQPVYAMTAVLPSEDVLRYCNLEITFLRASSSSASQ